MKVLSLIVLLAVITSCKTSGSGVSQTEGGGLTVACDRAGTVCESGSCVQEVPERQMTIAGLREIPALGGAATITEGGMMENPNGARTSAFASRAEVAIAPENITVTNPKTARAALITAKADYMESLVGNEKIIYVDKLIQASERARGSEYVGNQSVANSGRAQSLAESAEVLRQAKDVEGAVKLGKEVAATLADSYANGKPTFNPTPVIESLNGLIKSSGSPEATYPILVQLGRAHALAVKSGSQHADALLKALSGALEGDQVALNVVRSDGASLENITTAVTGALVKSTTPASPVTSPIPDTLSASTELAALKTQAASGKVVPESFGSIAAKQSAAVATEIAKIQATSARGLVEARGTGFLAEVQREVGVKTTSLILRK